MTKQTIIFDGRDASWYKAMTLHERLKTRALDISPREEGVDAWRFERWQAQFQGNNEKFVQRLKLDGLTEHELRMLLSEPAEMVRERFTEMPAWLEHLRLTFSYLVAHNEEFTSEQAQEKLLFSEDKSADFWAPFEIFIETGIQELRKGVEHLCEGTEILPFDTAHPEQYFLSRLLPSLYAIVSKAVALEVNIARLQGLLTGETAQERFRSFMQQLQQPADMLAFLQQYPVLACSIDTCIQQWVANALNFLTHLCADWDALCTTFYPQDDPGSLQQLTGDAGDLHQKGQSVMLLTFTSGLRLVYKPRSLQVDRHFQKFLLWLNERGEHPPFKTLQILDRGSYGWVEFVTMQGCSTETELQRFYQRQGAYLALLYVLAATDFHYENLIAAGEHPVLIDLESLFHPHTEGFLSENDEEALAGDALVNSVMRVMLLPQRAFFNQAQEGLEMSGLGGEAGQLTPYRVMLIEDVNMDTIHFVHKQVQVPGGQNRPQLNGKYIDVQEYSNDIVHGFTIMYLLLLEHRQVLLADDSPLASFAQDKVRVILRPTYTYSRLIQDSYHPDVLHDALDRDILFNRLWRDVGKHPLLTSVIASECADLHNGDIPFFTTRIDSPHLWDSTGTKLPNFFDCSGMDLVRTCLLKLSKQDLEKQIWFIRGSLTTLSTGIQKQWPVYSLADTTTPATSEQLIAQARVVGDRLIEQALHGKQDTTWIGLSFIDERTWHMTPLGLDMYNGLPGVILFLAYLGKISGEVRYTTLAQSAFATLRRQITRFGAKVIDIGVFSGWGGILYLFSHLATLWHNETLLAEAQTILETIEPLIEKNTTCDIVGGVAGCIAGLWNLYQLAPSEHILTMLRQCGEQILTHAQPMPAGIGWISENDTQALTGFSHGAAGIAWSLFKLAPVTGEQRFHTLALDAIAYERSRFSADRRNWPDLRDFVVQSMAPGTHAYMSSWCHGAPGIALARLDSLKYLNDATTLNEIDIALETTLESGFGLNHSLCHGDLGNIQVILDASRSYQSTYTAHLTRLTAGILASIETHGMYCGVPQGLETPGFMAGLAGIGYGLLRLAEPEKVPNILLLAPPITQ